MREVDKINDLLNYYKYVKTCSNSKCRRVFGTDGKYGNNLCPICLQFLVHGSSRIERFEKIQDKLSVSTKE